MDDPTADGEAVPTVGDYLREWLRIQRHRLQPSTLKSYAGNVERYLEPNLGEVPLDELGIGRLERLYARLMASGGADGGPLSPRTVQYAAATLRSALSDAVRTGVVDRNVAKLARLPRIDPRTDPEDDELQVWTPAQARSFLQQIRSEDHRDLWVVALGTGMRRGELLGLRWEDVDVDGETIYVRRSLQVVDDLVRLKQTKTSRSRSLRVDDRVLAALDRRRRLQGIHREAVGPEWDNGRGLVFTARDGSHLVPTTVTSTFRRVVRRLEVPVIRLQDVRHTHATLLLQAGVPIKVVSERLGHATTRITLDIYAHVLPAMDDDAVAAFASHVYGDDDQDGEQDGA